MRFVNLEANASADGTRDRIATSAVRVSGPLHIIVAACDSVAWGYDFGQTVCDLTLGVTVVAQNVVLIEQLRH